MTQHQELNAAIKIAVIAHENQVDKGAEIPFILHVLRVGLSLLDFKKTNLPLVTAGILHDVVEDSDYTLQGLKEYGFSEEVLSAVDAMTRRPEESYFQYVDRVKEHPMGARIKLADLDDNLDPLRQGFEGWKELHASHTVARWNVQDALGYRHATSRRVA